MSRKVVVLFSSLAALILAGAVVFFFREYTAPCSLKSGHVLFEIQPGQSVKTISRRLEEEHVISRGWIFTLGYRLFHSGKKMKAGEYELVLPLSAKGALLSLLEGKVFLHPLTIPEGLTGKEIADLVRVREYPLKGSFQEACGDPEFIADWDGEARDLEGYLFPDTYRFPKNTTARTIAETMVAQFKKIFGEDGLKKAVELDMTVREAVTLASLIEKETAIPEERPLVSAVFHNRLKLRMRLECDPTVIYALKQDGLYKGRLLSRDLKYVSPYNTYVAPGLPPGPICNPGRGSLEAALHPAAVNYLYFVAGGDGSHRFNRGYAEHLQAVRKLRLKKK